MKPMKIEDLILNKNEYEEVSVDSFSIPIQTLKNLMKDGYEYLRLYEQNRTASVWGKACSSCFTEQQLREKR
ncbi:MAG: hypothetical protein ACQEQO_09385 [Thermodesulfobacteriota bacterium]